MRLEKTNIGPTTLLILTLGEVRELNELHMVRTQAPHNSQSEVPRRRLQQPVHSDGANVVHQTSDDHLIVPEPRVRLASHAARWRGEGEEQPGSDGDGQVTCGGGAYVHLGGNVAYWVPIPSGGDIVT